MEEIGLDVLKAPVKTAYFQLLTMAIGGSFAGCIFSMVDAMVVGKYHGPVGTAALAVVGPVLAILYGLGFLTGIGGSVWFSNLRGSGKKEQADAFFTVSVILSGMLSAVVLLVLLRFAEPILRLFGSDDTLLILGKQYLKGIWIALPCCIITNLLAAYIRNDGNPVLVTVSVLAGGIVNVIGDIFLVFVCNMGIYGAGLATGVSMITTTLIMLSHFLTPKNTMRLVKPQGFLEKTGKIVVGGFSTAINDIAMGLLGVIFNRQIMKYLNTDALAVYGILSQITVFVQCCAYSTGQAAQPILSQNLGAKQPIRIRECLRYGLYTTCLFGILWTVMALRIPKTFVRLFMTPTASILSIAPKIIGVYGLSFLPLTVNVFAIFYFQSILRSAAATTVSLARGFVVSGGAAVLLPMLFGPDALWLAMLFADLLVGAFSVMCMVKYTKQLEK